MMPDYPYTNYAKGQHGLKWIIDKLLEIEHMIEESHSAENTTYDNSDSTLLADNVQDAIDELDQKIEDLDGTDIKYDNTDSGLVADNVQDAIDEIQNEIVNMAIPDAEDVPYDNTDSGLEATNVQEAIDELAAGGGGEPYVLPIASDSRLGGIKVGARLTIDPSTGVLSADEQGGGTGTAVEVFIDPTNGDDTNSGLDIDHPLKTLTAVLAVNASSLDVKVIQNSTLISLTFPTGTIEKNIKLTPYSNMSGYYIQYIMKNVTIKSGITVNINNNPLSVSSTGTNAKLLDVNSIENYGTLIITGGHEGYGYSNGSIINEINKISNYGKLIFNQVYAKVKFYTTTPNTGKIVIQPGSTTSFNHSQIQYDSNEVTTQLIGNAVPTIPDSSIYCPPAIVYSYNTYYSGASYICGGNTICIHDSRISNASLNNPTFSIN